MGGEQQQNIAPRRSTMAKLAEREKRKRGERMLRNMASGAHAKPTPVLPPSGAMELRAWFGSAQGATRYKRRSIMGVVYGRPERIGTFRFPTPNLAAKMALEFPTRSGRSGPRFWLYGRPDNRCAAERPSSNPRSGPRVWAARRDTPRSDPQRSTQAMPLTVCAPSGALRDVNEELASPPSPAAPSCPVGGS